MYSSNMSRPPWVGKSPANDIIAIIMWQTTSEPSQGDHYRISSGQTVETDEVKAIIPGSTP